MVNCLRHDLNLIYLSVLTCKSTHFFVFTKKNRYKHKIKGSWGSVQPLCPLCVLRKATEKEVEWLLTWMLDFAGDERMLKLYKRVCRAYWQSYPETVAYYIMEYRKWYDPESLIIVERKFFRYAST